MLSLKFKNQVEWCPAEEDHRLPPHTELVLEDTSPSHPLFHIIPQVRKRIGIASSVGLALYLRLDKEVAARYRKELLRNISWRLVSREGC